MHSLELHSWFVALVFLSTESFVYCQECSPSPCENGGACLELQTTFFCVCEDGYIGRRCEVAGMAMVCEHNTCGNGGTCTSSYGVITCDCRPDYTGSRCDTLMEEDPCSSNPCENGGSCQSSHDGFTCDCVEGYTGTQCTVEEDPCSSNPCKNGGSCQSSEDSFTCDCVEGYTGSQCTEEEDPCLSSPCDNGGSCKRTNSSFTCQCLEGYTGNRCKVAAFTDHCVPNPCQNGGICNGGTGEFSCICTEDYTGKMCENRQDIDLPTEDTIEDTTPSYLNSTTESPASNASVGKLITSFAVLAVFVLITSFCVYQLRDGYKKWEQGKVGEVNSQDESKKDTSFRRYLTEELLSCKGINNGQDHSSKKTEDGKIFIIDDKQGHKDSFV